MLAVSNLSKSYGIKPILSSVSFTVKSGERLGLVGPNGCGKTTLLRILSGLEPPDHGSVRFTPAKPDLGYLPQGLVIEDKETIGEYLDRFQNDINQLSARLAEISERMVIHPDSHGLQDEYDRILQKMSSPGISQDEKRMVLHQLELDHFTENTPINFLSGGQKTRLALAGILLSNPQILFLDEPTNHLDIEMLEWLEEWLIHGTFTMIVVSHDRAFLDHVTTGILELDSASHQIREYPGNYTLYQNLKASEKKHQMDAYQEQQEEIQKLREAAAHLRGIARFRKGGKGDSGDKFARGFFANRTKGTVGRAKQIEKKIEQILTTEKIEKPGRNWQIKVEFSDVSSGSRDVLRMENLTIGYDSDHPLVTDINQTIRFGQKIALMGKNGSGKSTLLKTLVGQVQPLAGKVAVGASIRIGYMDQEQKNLPTHSTPLKSVSEYFFASETETRAFLSKFLFFGDDVFTPVSDLSFGERARLYLAILVAQGCNLLLLDEPVNHLDIPSRIRFEEALNHYHGTLLAVVHDRYFIQNIATTLWKLENRVLSQIA
ncbi:ATPase components of ABC transporters with duplicated ATPase domains [Anaerolinea thermolimosa]|uniref:ribosomal protection-like ABC-F family protein n=1 Tax=Anaerolinea thermolimosa TaxID=229919 RepID=UPI0007811454|nr:ABC-F family ATP-binding cassette domain-containing protein [Anaerolinea thermolimosa]GAP06703.1 ATPase components of ABC transporters with duplicated ATPase domains [Anaerolinea thermolimosa]